MKNIIKRILREAVLVEAFQDLEYHVTPIDNLIKIIAENKMYLKTWVSKGSEGYGDKFYYLSLSRTGYPDLAYGTRVSDFARIVFDGRKLGYNFKSMPVDYWNLDYQSKPYRLPQNFEFEDRLVTDKGVIENISRYIVRIEVLRGGDKFDDKLARLRDLCKERGIELRVYGSKGDMAKGVNMVDMDDFGGGYDEDSNEVEIDGIEDFYINIVPLLIYDNRYYDDYDLFKENFKDFLVKNNIEYDDDMVYPAHRRIAYINNIHSSFIEELNYNINSIMASKRKSGLAWSLIQMLTNQMRSYGVRDVEGLMEAKVNGLRKKGVPRVRIGDYRIYRKIFENEWLMVGHNVLMNDRYIFFYSSCGEKETIDNMRESGATFGDMLGYLFNKYEEWRVIDMVERCTYGDFKIKKI
jgi:hypothetical protein